MNGKLILCSGSHSYGQEVNNLDTTEILERAHLYLTTKTTLPLTHAFFEGTVVYRTDKHAWSIDITKMVEDYGRNKRLS